MIEPAKVGHDEKVPGGNQRRNLVVPPPPKLRRAVQEQQRRVVTIASSHHMQRRVSYVDEPAADVLRSKQRQSFAQGVAIFDCSVRRRVFHLVLATAVQTLEAP